jgi:hypothetical protein
LPTKDTKGTKKRHHSKQTGIRSFLFLHFVIFVTFVGKHSPVLLSAAVNKPPNLSQSPEISDNVSLATVIWAKLPGFFAGVV